MTSPAVRRSLARMPPSGETGAFCPACLPLQALTVAEHPVPHWACGACSRVLLPPQEARFFIEQALGPGARQAVRWGAETNTQCPICIGALRQAFVNGVQVSACTECGTLWLPGPALAELARPKAPVAPTAPARASSGPPAPVQPVGHSGAPDRLRLPPPAQLGRHDSRPLSPRMDGFQEVLDQLDDPALVSLDSGRPSRAPSRRTAEAARSARRGTVPPLAIILLCIAAVVMGALAGVGYARRHLSGAPTSGAALVPPAAVGLDRSTASGSESPPSKPDPNAPMEPGALSTMLFGGQTIGWWQKRLDALARDPADAPLYNRARDRIRRLGFVVDEVAQVHRVRPTRRLVDQVAARRRQ